MAKVYDVKQVAEMLKVSVSSVRRLIKEGKLKAFKTHGRGYIVNEMSLLVFMGHKIEDCIIKEDFEEALKLFSKDSDGKIDRDKFFDYYCSLFVPGPDLTHDYYIIKDKPILAPKAKHVSESAYTKEYNDAEDQPNTFEDNKTMGVALTKADIIVILESLDKIQGVLRSKIE